MTLDSRSPHRYALSAILVGFLAVAGTASLIATPPFQVPDEPTHAARVFQLAQGTVRGERRGSSAGGVVPRAVVRDLSLFGELPFHPERQLSRGSWREKLSRSTHLTPAELRDRVYAHFPNTILYSPLPYAPATLGVWIGTRFQATTVECVYLARATTLLAVLGLLFIAFDLVRFCRRYVLVLFGVAALPMAIFEMASCSADGVTLGLAILLAALVVRLDHAWDARVFHAFLVVAAALSLCKSVYAPLALAAIPAVWRARGSPKARALFTGLTVASAVVPGALWGSYVRELFVPGWAAAIDPAGQLRFALGHPASIVHVFTQDLVANFERYHHQAIGVFGWLDAPLNDSVIALAETILVVTALLSASSGDSDARLGFRQASVHVVVGLATCLGVMMALYTTWTPLRSGTVEGIQGRYFLPVLPLLLLAFPPLARIRDQLWSRLYTGGIIAMWAYVDLRGIRTLLHRYWI